MTTTLLRRESQARPESFSRRGARWGRVVLWSLLALVAIYATLGNGLGVIGEDDAAVVAPVVGERFPGLEAQAFASGFARLYLSYSPGRAEAQQEQLERLMTSAVRVDGAVARRGDAAPQRVVETWVARSRSLSGRSGVVTVAVLVSQRGRLSTRYLAVPVAQVGATGLVVSDYPAFVSPSRVATDTPARAETPVSAADAPAIESMLTRFFREYLDGGPVPPEFFAPGSFVPMLGESYEFVDLVSVAQAGPGAGPRRVVLAQVLARDPRADAEYTLRYRVGVLRRDRWLVQNLTG